MFDPIPGSSRGIVKVPIRIVFEDRFAPHPTDPREHLRRFLREAGLLPPYERLYDEALDVVFAGEINPCFLSEDP